MGDIAVAVVVCVAVNLLMLLAVPVCSDVVLRLRKKC
jgi:hypothetical protein